jgi:DNA invertase Pin-like site-specific DNA recombinase
MDENKGLRIFAYARVSMENVGTKEKPDEREQNPEAQLKPIREECERRGWVIVQEFVDRQTGTEMYRPEFKKMMEQAGAGQAEMVIVARADRFSRFSPIDALVVVDELKRRGIGFYSLYEPYASNIPENTVPKGMRGVILHISFVMAEGESEKISDRTKKGIEAKRDTCKNCGHKKESHDGACQCSIKDCHCPHFKSSWSGGRPKGSLDSFQRAAPRAKVEMTPQDLFKPMA